jgi:CPA2 family monovalent cation:H+ antiporter-2
MFLLLFLGLEFSIGKLIGAGKPIVSAGILDLVVNFPLGYLLGILFGWSQIESLLLAGIVYTSSSGIITKSLIDLRKLANPETEMILGIMIFEDLFIAIFLSVLSGIALTENSSTFMICLSVIKAFVFCLAFIIFARKFGGKISKLIDIKSDELFILFLFSLVMLVSGFAKMIGISEAVGAFLIGLVFAETAHVRKIEGKIISIRDIFASMFFFSFGMTIDFRFFGDVWQLLIIAIPLSIAGKLLSGIIAAKVNRFSGKAALNVGFGTVARGEFSVIISNIALLAGFLPLIQSFTAAYVLILGIVGPMLMKESDVVYGWSEKVRFPRNKWKKLINK